MVLNMTIRVVELFAGVGGFRVGLTKASDAFEFVWANQWEPGKKVQHAFNCYVQHFGESENHVNEDIAKVKHLIPDHDLLVGGFPCQDYSVAATGAKGIQGKKGVLWWEIRDIVENKRPKYILLENVDRLIKSPASQRGRDFGIMLKSLDQLGYTTEWRVINAADYGNAQRRRRVFIFAYKNNSSYSKLMSNKELNSVILNDGLFAQSFPCHKKEKSKESSIDLVSFNDLVDMTSNFTFLFKNSGICRNGFVNTIEVEPNKIKFIPLKDILQNEPLNTKYFLNGTLEKWDYLKGSKKIPRIKPNGELYNYSEGPIAFPENLDLPARTMLTSESSVNRSTHVVEDPLTNKYRLLTEIECERLNGFPDNWTSTGMPSKFRYFCMGNALVTELVKELGLNLISIIKND